MGWIIGLLGFWCFSVLGLFGLYSSAVRVSRLLNVFMCFGMRHTLAFMLKSVKCENSILLLHSRISAFSTDITFDFDSCSSV